jgi:acid phosphatase type 7
MKTITTTFFVTLFVSTLAFSQAITRQPYIQNVKTDSVEILWRTDEPAESWLAIRPVGSSRNFTYYHCNVPTVAHQVKAPGLEPHTFYEYQAGFSRGNKGLSEIQSFRTLPPEDATAYSFIIYGDHRNYPNRHRAVVEAILETMKSRQHPDFVLDTGDFTGQGEHETDFYNEQFFDPARGLIERVCYFPVIGNHESFRKHPRIPFRYLEYFSVPTENSGTEYYYSFDVGDAHYIMLDVYATDFSTGSKQWHWLDEDLKNTDKTWRFAAMHYPIYIHRSGPTVSYGNQEIREHLVPLFEKYGVAAVFSGDSHFYQRSIVNGIQYVCSGGGGAPLYDPGNEPDYVQASAKKNHYVWADLDGDQLTIEAFDAENNLLDKVTFGPRAPEKPEQLPLNFSRKLPGENMNPGQTYIIESTRPDGEVNLGKDYQEFGEMAYSTVKSSAEGLSGENTRFSGNEAADARVRWTPRIEKEGQYLFSVTVPGAGSVDAPNTYFEVYHDGEMAIRGRVDLSHRSAGDKWYEVGLIPLSPGDSVELIEAEDEPGRFYADAVKFTLYEDY